MAILDEVLLEEYERMKKMRVVMKAEMDTLPKGYISKKNIYGRQYHYLQRREGSKIVSTFISEKNVAEAEAQIQRRKQLKASLAEIEESMKKIERVIR
ncbi:MAG: hypothetical protein Q4C22_01995 [Bacillota bacterium]|nr:hypothetical protein [Bacillota bacterium]